MSKTSKVPTMKDVAQEAGVSLGTVSKVFNGLPVGKEYKVRVEAAAKKLGYQVNVYARGLRSNQTNTVALIIPGLANPFFANLADYCCDLLHEKGYRMMLATTSFDPDMEQQCIDMVQQNKVDGIIAITYNPHLEINDDIPFIIIDRKLNSNVPCISSDNFHGGELAAEKLSENGCQKFLFLGVSARVPGEADKRRSGFESYCIQHQLSYKIHATYDDEPLDNIFNFIDDNIIDGRFNYDGIFCNTDTLARQIMQHFSKYSISVPDDVQIIGYDGIKQFGSDDYYCSTIRQPLYEMAEVAVELLLTKDRKSSPSLVCLPVTYCYGGTTRK